MALRRVSWSSNGSHSLPPGATGPATSGAGSSRPNNYSQLSLNAMLNAPSRLAQPHLHPQKLNGALWFGVDPSVHAFIRATWQGLYMGRWKNWSDVPQERRDIWWQTFVQNYYWEDQFKDLVYAHWKKQTRTTICERISKKKRAGKKPKYIGDEDWTFLMEHWATEPARKKSRKAAKSRNSDPVGKGVHKHSAGPVSFSKIEYDMMVESGDGEAPAYTELVQKTRTRKDGTYIDYRAELLVSEVEKEAAQLSNSDGSPNGQNASSAPSRALLNKAYIKLAQPKKGYIYGLGSVQYKSSKPNSRLPDALARNLNLEMRMTDIEANVESIKEDNAATRAAIDKLIQTISSQHPTSATATAPTGHNSTPAANVPTPDANVQTATPATNQPANNNLDEWCRSIGGFCDDL